MEQIPLILLQLKIKKPNVPLQNIAQLGCLKKVDITHFMDVLGFLYYIVYLHLMCIYCHHVYHRQTSQKLLVE